MLFKNRSLVPGNWAGLVSPCLSTIYISFAFLLFSLFPSRPSQWILVAVLYVAVAPAVAVSAAPLPLTHAVQAILLDLLLMFPKPLRVQASPAWWTLSARPWSPNHSPSLSSHPAGTTCIPLVSASLYSFTGIFIFCNSAPGVTLITASWCISTSVFQGVCWASSFKHPSAGSLFYWFSVLYWYCSNL